MSRDDIFNNITVTKGLHHCMFGISNRKWRRLNGN